jgi:hypothetical protein
MTIMRQEPMGSREHERIRRESIEEQIRRRGIKPMRFADDRPCDDVFESDEELEAFLSFVYSERHASLA